MDNTDAQSKEIGRRMITSIEEHLEEILDLTGRDMLPSAWLLGNGTTGVADNGIISLPAMYRAIRRRRGQ